MKEENNILKEEINEIKSDLKTLIKFVKDEKMINWENDDIDSSKNTEEKMDNDKDEF